MRAVLRTSFADLRRRRVQSAVVALVVLLSSLAGAVALNLLVESDAPFDTAFAAASGAHLVLHVDSTHVTAARVGATASLPPVAAAAGPWREVMLAIEGGGRPGDFLNLVGRGDPGGPVDRLQLIAGRWVQRGGEVVLARRMAERLQLAPGGMLQTAGAQGVAALQVVGVAASVNDNSDAWVTPPQAMALRGPVNPGGAAKGPPPPPAWQMQYRLHDPSTAASIQAASNQIARHLPVDAVVGSDSWLAQRTSADTTTAVMIPSLLAFSAFALAAAAVIIGNVVSGAVIAGYRDIGVMKSIGFTPAQVLVTLLVQILVPAAAGAVIGVAAGVVASQPFLSQTSDAFDLPAPDPVVPWVVAACVGALLSVVVLAALVPGLRAARLSAAEAIATGSAPGGRIRRAGSLLSRLPLPRAATLGAGDSLARPVRSAMTLIAVVLGVATITFAVGLSSSLADVKAALVRDASVQVVATRDGGGDLGQAMSDQQLSSLIAAQPGTAHYVAEALTEAHVTGVSAPIPVFGYRGDASWTGYVLISGRWFSAPGEAVAPTALLTAAGLHVGDRVRVSEGGRSTMVRLVGEIFDQQGDNLLLRTGWSTVAAVDPGAQPRTYEIAVSGVDARQYAERLDAATTGYPVGVEVNGSRGYDLPFLLITSAVAGLAVVLTLCALAGVFNTVVLTVREKARDTAILRALGMSPRQAVLMVLSSVAVIGVAGVVVGIPAGIALHHQILTMMGHIASGTGIPQPFLAVFPPSLLVLLAVAGLAVALAGAWFPARWAARARTGDLLAPE